MSAARLAASKIPMQSFLRSVSLCGHSTIWNALPAARDRSFGMNYRLFVRNPNTTRTESTARKLSSSLRRAAPHPIMANNFRAEIESATTVVLDKCTAEPIVEKRKPKEAPAHLQAVAVIHGEMKALAKLAATVDESFDAAVETIEQRPSTARLVVTGLGKSGHIGRKIAASLSSTGTASLFMHAAEALHGDLGLVREGDVVILLSNSGETEEVLVVQEMVKRLGAKTIAVVAARSSSLGERCDVCLEIGHHQELDHNRLAPSASAVAMMAMGDALALVLSERMGFTQEQFKVCHPGGQLGKR